MRAAASLVLASTNSPLVSRSSRCTSLGGCSGSGPRNGSMLTTSIEFDLPCTARPGGLLKIIKCESSYTSDRLSSSTLGEEAHTRDLTPLTGAAASSLALRLCASEISIVTTSPVWSRYWPRSREARSASDSGVELCWFGTTVTCLRERTSWYTSDRPSSGSARRTNRSSRIDESYALTVHRRVPGSSLGSVDGSRGWRSVVALGSCSATMISSSSSSSSWPSSCSYGSGSRA